MTKLRAKPCSSCPYLRSTPVGIWSPQHFEDTVSHDHAFGHRYACHLKTGDICVGWLADQKRRDVPNMHQRIVLMTDAVQLKRFEAVDETSPSLYASIAEMVAANEGQAFPARSRKARALARKVAR